MKMKKIYSVAIIAVILLACSGEKVDLIVHNAKIYTVDGEFKIAEAMAIKNDTIVEIGAEHQILNKYGATSKIDANSMFIYPGFIDAHCHFYGYGLNTLQANLIGTKSWEEVIEKLKEKGANQNGWILGRGWDQNDWEEKSFPNKSSLSEFGDQPIFLIRVDGHAAMVNQAAMDLAGITAETEVEGGIIEKINGETTGLLIDNAVTLIEQILPKPDKDTKIKAIQQAEADCVKRGLTSVDDAGLELETIQLIDEMHTSGDLKIKMYAMANPTEENLSHYLKSGPYASDRLTVSSFKVYCDGALGSRGAKLLQPYSDVHDGHSGLFLSDSTSIADLAKKLFDSGFQMNTHAIGDSANRLILNIYGALLNGVNDRRWRIEHAQVVNPNDFELFRTHTIIPSVQPTHATSDMYWAEERLGEERIKTAYAYQQLLEQNGILALGTDFPVEYISPIKTFYAAVSRMDASGYPSGGYFPEQALSRENALRGMTIWAALSNFEEHRKGSLEPGKAADFVILNQDLIDSPVENILQTEVISTFINGESVYNSGILR